MDTAELDNLMTEAAALDEGILACLKTPDGAYALRFEDTDVLAEWDGTRDRLVLSTEIGKPAGQAATEVYETLLSYNLMWRETGGVRLALTGRGGNVLQLVDLAGTEVAAAKVAVVAANLAERTRIWQAYLESAEGDGEPSLPEAALTDVVFRA